MTTITYPPQPYHRLKRQQLITLAIALEEQRDRAYASRDQAVALLTDASRHLRSKCHAGRHDNWGEGYTCAACKLAAEIDAALDPPAPPTGEDET